LVGDFSGCRFSGRWSVADEQLEGADIRLVAVPDESNTFKVNGSETHLVRFCCQDCLKRSYNSDGRKAN
jgi:hypothetical protein